MYFLTCFEIKIGEIHTVTADMTLEYTRQSYIKTLQLAAQFKSVIFRFTVPCSLT